ncbi:MAG: helix-turn-helix domain-containing protein [Phycisphaeraceae bacterium]
MGAGKDRISQLHLISLDKAAEILSISKRTLQRLISAGEFPSPVKIGAASRVLVADIERFIERQRGGRQA